VVGSFEHLISAKLIELPHNSGPATARNTGATHARGSWLVFVDDDCIPEPGWLSALERRLESQPQLLVGGGLRNGVPSNLCAEASHQLVCFLGKYYNTDPSDAAWFTSANIACSREAFAAIGGFGSGFPLAAAEDRDFCDRWHEAGYRLALAPDAVVEHARVMSLPQFFDQHYTYGRGAHYLHEARTRRGAISHRLEPLRFYWRLVFHPLTNDTGWRAPLLMALLVLSQVAYATGYYGERAQARRVRAAGLGAAKQPEARHELIEAAVTAEAQAQPRPVGR
jgi:GT2 family glycosyltransferase